MYLTFLLIEKKVSNPYCLYPSKPGVGIGEMAVHIQHIHGYKVKLLLCYDVVDLMLTSYHTVPLLVESLLVTVRMLEGIIRV